MYWDYVDYVAKALVCLRMGKSHRAITLNQHWGRTGNIFPYFSPVPPAFVAMGRTSLKVRD
jgi:hypothetical protein